MLVVKKLRMKEERKERMKDNSESGKKEDGRKEDWLAVVFRLRLKCLRELITIRTERVARGGKREVRWSSAQRSKEAPRTRCTSVLSDHWK